MEVIEEDEIPNEADFVRKNELTLLDNKVVSVNMWVKVIYEGEVFIGKIMEKQENTSLV